MVNTLIKYGFVPHNEEKAIKDFENLFANVRQAEAKKPYIGSDDIY